MKNNFISEEAFEEKLNVDRDLRCWHYWTVGHRHCILKDKLWNIHIVYINVL